MLRLFDAHCDVLFRMERDPSLQFLDGEALHINFKRLSFAGSKVQCFALFMLDTIPDELKFKTALNMIDIFYDKVIGASPLLKPVRTKKDIESLKENEIGAMLTLEGCDAIGTDLVKLRTLFRLGVKSVGLTWNNSNAVADGAQESRAAGLSDFGRKVVQENNQHKVWTDVSHLSEKAFWDVLEEATFPIASHSNAKALCDHPRNLSDEQIKALLGKSGVIGVTFVPQFLTGSGQAKLTDILKHIDHIASLGGIHQIGLGSDFDGIDTTPENLSNFGEYPLLINELLKHYKEEEVEGFLFNNFYRALPE